MTKPLSTLLNRRSLRRWAGGRSFERGEEYFSSGLVRGLVEDAGAVTAKVRGSRDYRVKLWVEEGEIAFSCTCPVGEEGAFCKHCVAVGWPGWNKRFQGGARPSAVREAGRDDGRRPRRITCRYVHPA